MRFKVVLILAAVVLLAATVLVVLTKPNSASRRQGVIELTNLPDQYCPLLATFVATDLDVDSPKVLLDTAVPIDGCRFIALSKLTGLEDKAQRLFIKLPDALAFRVTIDSLSGRYQYAPALGDVNDDNIIDSTDEAQISAALFSTDPSQVSTFDLDRDKSISVLDLAITRLNRRSGLTRPDGESWSQS